MVMKVAHTMSISPASSVYDLWSGTYTINEFDNDALTIGTGTKTYKSSVVDNWSNYQISAVGLSQNSQLLNIRRTTPSSVKFVPEIQNVLSAPYLGGDNLGRY